ncbi:hypothetical protein [Paenibacillus oryzisoli]|nr:hypothetical protein [Paenibacillus oryzisoli]
MRKEPVSFTFNSPAGRDVSHLLVNGEKVAEPVQGKDGLYRASVE